MQLKVQENLLKIETEVNQLNAKHQTLATAVTEKESAVKEDPMN